MLISLQRPLEEMEGRKWEKIVSLESSSYTVSKVKTVMKPDF